jgi:hypothetical protein
MYYTLLRAYVKLRRKLQYGLKRHGPMFTFFNQELAVMRKNLTIVFLSLVFLMPSVSHAARDYGNAERIDAFFGEVYLGIKYGRVTIAEDIPDSDGADIRNLGFAFGKGINDTLAIEFDYNTTVTEDDTSSGDLSADTIGLYLVAKTQGTVYFKGRVGYTRTTLERNFNDDSFDHNSYGIAYGAAAGVKIGKSGAIEIEYTIMPDIDDSGFVGAPVEVESDFVSISYVMGVD